MCGFQRCSSLCEQTEAPKQGSAQVEVMKGTGSDKMCREEGGRGRERPAQTNALTRKPQQEKRQEMNNGISKVEHNVDQ